MSKKQYIKDLERLNQELVDSNNAKVTQIAELEKANIDLTLKLGVEILNSVGASTEEEPPVVILNDVINSILAQNLLEIDRNHANYLTIRELEQINSLKI